MQDTEQGMHPRTIRNAQEDADGNALDMKGRIVPEDMDERDVMNETLTRLRVLCDVFEALGSHPLAAGMLPGVKF